MTDLWRVILKRLWLLWLSWLLMTVRWLLGYQRMRGGSTMDQGQWVLTSV